MLTAFTRSRDRNKRHQDEHLATDSADNPQRGMTLPEDNDQAIDVALMHRSLPLLQQVVARGGIIK